MRCSGAECCAESVQEALAPRCSDDAGEPPSMVESYVVITKLQPVCSSDHMGKITTRNSAILGVGFLDHLGEAVTFRHGNNALITSAKVHQILLPNLTGRI